MEIYDYGLFGLFFVCLLASSLWPLGSEAFVIGFLVFGYSPYLVFLVASIGNILGSLSTYYLAYYGGEPLVQKLFPSAHKKLESYKFYIQKYGIFCAFFAFLPFVGDVLVLLLGLYRYNQYMVWLFISLGKCARYAVLIGMYCVLGQT